MADVTGFKQALAELTDLLPRVPVVVAGLMEAQAALVDAAEQFAETVEARQAEAAELFPRLEVALAGSGREAAEGAAQIEQHREVAGDLADPALGFEEKVNPFLLPFIDRQQRLIQAKVAALARHQHQAATLDASRQSLRDGLTGGRRQVSGASDTTVNNALGLQSVVDAARGTVGGDVEKLGAEIDTQHTTQAGEVEGLRRDVESYEASFVERVDRIREAVRQEADNMAETMRDRLDDLGAMLSRAMFQLRDALRELDEFSREAAEEGGDGRESLHPYYEDLEQKLAPLKQAIEQVREAANLVGIPF
jgi:hypothetical protein